MKRITREEELAAIEAELRGPRFTRITPEMASAYDDRALSRAPLNDEDGAKPRRGRLRFVRRTRK